MEDRYHEAEEERINQQVAAEMELEKKQNNLDQAYKDLERVQKEIVKVHSTFMICTHNFSHLVSVSHNVLSLKFLLVPYSLYETYKNLRRNMELTKILDFKFLVK